MLDVLYRPGIWKRAGLSGVLSGLDLAEAMASLPVDRGFDREFARRLFMLAERPFVAAVIALIPTKED